ncbi:hypothetical protein DSM43518_02663 [Mycobacterium marinum]|nr:hypothetical protein DSM43518_02663 [Mycobacterium marinum]
MAGGVVAGDDDCLIHPVEGSQGGGDFAAFDAVATDFDLLVGAAQILQLPIRAPTHQVTGAIHPRPARPERAGHKPGRTQPAPAPIADTHPGTGDIQLTHGPRRHRAQPPIEHEHPGPGHGGADRHHSGAGVQRWCGGEVDRGFGGAVGVDQGSPRGPLIDQLCWAGLTDQDDSADFVEALGAQRPQPRRGVVEHTDVFVDE